MSPVSKIVKGGASAPGLALRTFASSSRPATDSHALPHSSNYTPHEAKNTRPDGHSSEGLNSNVQGSTPEAEVHNSGAGEHSTVTKSKTTKTTTEVEHQVRASQGDDDKRSKIDHLENPSMSEEFVHADRLPEDQDPLKHPKKSH